MNSIVNIYCEYRQQYCITVLSMLLRNTLDCLSFLLEMKTELLSGVH